jgi:hypothetical protein
MTSQELAEAVEMMVAMASQRVKGPGDEQYSRGEEQQFESMELDELLTWTEEELIDLVVYSTMLWIRLERIRKRLEIARVL